MRYLGQLTAKPFAVRCPANACSCKPGSRLPGLSHKKIPTMRDSLKADDGNQNLCFYLLYNLCFVDFSFTYLHNTSCFCTLYKFLVSFQYQKLESLGAICYIVNRKGTTAHKGLASLNLVDRITTSSLGQSFGVVFLCLKTLLQVRKYECQQCQNEHSKSHKVFKIKWFLVHQHHPHSM